MKNLITIINLSIIIAVVSIFMPSEELVKESIDPDTQINAGGNVVMSSENNSPVRSDFAIWPVRWDGDEELVNFIKDLTESRIMGLEQGKIAMQKSINRPLKDYGALMISDQTKMLADLKSIAVGKKISIPGELASDKAKTLDGLKQMHGKTFDKKFINQMIRDHKRDIKKLERAARSADPDVQVFATKYLPVIQSHLDKIKALKEGN